MINWSGKRRWIALLLVIASVVVMIFVPPVLPVIQLPGEQWPGVQILGLPLTNSLVGSVVVWILIGLLIFYIARNRPKSGGEVPRGGFYNFFELLYEFLYNFIEGIAGGKWMGYIWSFFFTIFIIVLLSNWLEIIPGVDSVGFLEPHLDEQTGQPLDGFDTYQGFLGIWSVNGKCAWVSPQAAASLTAEDIQTRKNNGCTSGVGAPIAAGTAAQPAVEATPVSGATPTAEATPGTAVTTATEGAATSGGEAASAAEQHYVPGDPSVPWVVRPYVRVPSTDLNLTISLALIAVVMTQVVGVRALGPRYFTKFVNYTTLLKSPAGGMDLGISLLEMIGEFAKILSFSFRLLGNMFAGSILLFVITFLVPAVVPWVLFLFEFFVGIIQAMVFGMLTAIFMNTATISHHAEEHVEEAVEGEGAH
jgi:F-type H+-transporting ATPase subunit a